MIFETERLKIRSLKESDRTPCFNMMSNPNVPSPITLPIMDKAESDTNFEKHLDTVLTSNTKVRELYS